MFDINIKERVDVNQYGPSQNFEKKLYETHTGGILSNIIIISLK